MPSGLFCCFPFAKFVPALQQQSQRGKLAVIMDLTGCGTALVTPFRRDGALDELALQSLVNWQIESGIDFLIPCGTTGEAATLSEAEWLRVVEVVVGAAAGRVPVFAGNTHNATHEAVARTKKLALVKGLTGILTANPYYNKPGQEGQYQHFRAIAEATELPVLLYNIPGRTGANLEPATVLRLAELKNVIGVKESSGNHRSDYRAADYGAAQLQGVGRRRQHSAAGDCVGRGWVGFCGFECDSEADVADGSSGDWERLGDRAGDQPTVLPADAGALLGGESGSGEGCAAMIGRGEDCFDCLWFLCRMVLGASWRRWPVSLDCWLVLLLAGS